MERRAPADMGAIYLKILLLSAWSKLWTSRFCRFLFVGGTATLLQMLLLIFLVEHLGAEPVVASATSYALSAIYNYILNYYLTFASSKRHAETFPKFLGVVGFGLTANTFFFFLFFKLTNYYLLAQAIAILVTLFVNYILHKFWIYRS